MRRVWLKQCGLWELGWGRGRAASAAELDPAGPVNPGHRRCLVDTEKGCRFGRRKFFFSVLFYSFDISKGLPRSPVFW